MWLWYDSSNTTFLLLLRAGFHCTEDSLASWMSSENEPEGLLGTILNSRNLLQVSESNQYYSSQRGFSLTTKQVGVYGSSWPSLSFIASIVSHLNDRLDRGDGRWALTYLKALFCWSNLHKKIMAPIHSRNSEAQSWSCLYSSSSSNDSSPSSPTWSSSPSLLFSSSSSRSYMVKVVDVPKEITPPVPLEPHKFICDWRCVWEFILCVLRCLPDGQWI